jgi:hypothetical protein
MNESIIEEIKNHDFGFLTLFELVDRISTIDCKEGKIVAEQIEKIRNTDEYQEALMRFHRVVEDLFLDNREIYSILSYYQLMMKK